MQITDIKIRKLISEGKLKAIVSVTLDNLIAIHDIKVIEGPLKLFVAMPSRREENGTYRDIVHPISIEGRELFNDKIIAAYHAAVESEVEQQQLLQQHDDDIII